MAPVWVGMVTGQKRVSSLFDQCYGNALTRRMQLLGER
jgi:hypothetical protein